MDDNCLHENTATFENGSGYCVDCGETLKIITPKTKKECDHSLTFETDEGITICKVCNIEITSVNYDPEWRYYNQSSGTVSRCNAYSKAKSLAGVFVDHGLVIKEAMLKLVEQRYKTIVGDKPVRGKQRTAIIATCLFYVYHDFNEQRTTDYIRNLFSISKKDMADGVRKYCNIYKDARTIKTTPQNLIKWILILTEIDECHYDKIKLIVDLVTNTTELLKRSTPQSIAAASVYFYLCINREYKDKLGMTKSKFAEKSQLSDITITKLIKEIASTTNLLVDEIGDI